MSNSVASNYAAGGLYAADGRRKYINRVERLRFLKALEAMEPPQALFGLTLAWTGARVSEVLALTRASFQLECGVVAFATLKRRRYCVREVPIPPALMVALDREFTLAALRPPGADQERLWRWRRETGWRIIKRAMKAARVEGRCACPRGLRHGLGVGAIQAGVPLTLLQRWLGHARLSTTAIYTDAIGPEERAIAARFWRF